ncbi:hypothetical protein [Leeuwenhoekiella parthenopeia]|uniref:Uncharacterized protein n=1 Tax=Leeuwenhoekiella parthenopeia TaxID=2890320 RepID=A0ABS8GV46_9FLAO|nr:hypothetical protein [Leeuwenhoekiella parthenopeia]MCC4213890.1 hypothetical protein [Leeuwenhoekiella parthenopeia]
MGTQELKKRIKSYVERGDDKVLAIVHGVFENYYQDEIVAYFPDGSPMSRKEYNMQLENAEDQIGRGEFSSIEDVENQIPD